VVRANATKYEIPHRFFVGDESTHIQKIVSGDNIFIIQPGNTFENFHEKVCFQDLIRDTCIPGKYSVPAKDTNCGNSGPSVGLCSSQGTSCLPDDAYAAPQFADGAFRYTKVFCIISDTTRSLLSHVGETDKLPPSGSNISEKQKFYNQRCEDICVGNLYLSLSFKIYLHHPDYAVKETENFCAHRDLQNPDYKSPNDIFFSAWDTWFEPLLKLVYVTGTIIACGRQSQEELFERVFKIGRATEEILSRALLVASLVSKRFRR
jgi:hypothetical protein